MGKLRIRHLLVAGGAGFLGAAFVRDRLRADPEILITVLDALRRPGAGADLADVADDRRFKLVRGDVSDRPGGGQFAGAGDRPTTLCGGGVTGGGGGGGAGPARPRIPAKRAWL